MTNDDIYYVTIDTDFEHKVFTVSVEYTSRDGRVHSEACYILDSLKNALLMAKCIKMAHEEEWDTVKLTINS